MKILTPGKYRLTADWSTRGTTSIGQFRKGTIITITQVDDVHNKVIGPKLHDWTYNDLPVEPVMNEPTAGNWQPGKQV
jgi:hypothetical protein